MTLLYDLVISLYGFGIRIASLFNSKARQWIKGRQSVFSELDEKLIKGQPSIWMHCASLGEFEQGRPVLEKIHQQFPQHQIVLSFFSPSGFEMRKDFPLAQVVCYLPLDTAKHAKGWVEKIQPALALFVKYEFWHHYLQQLEQQQCPTLLISASFRPDQIFFKPYGGFFKRMLFRFRHIFVQTEASANLLAHQKVQAVSIAGDTRVDRVIQIVEEAKTLPLIAQFTGNQPTLIVGSSWETEDQIIKEFLNQKKYQLWKVIIAPHEIKEEKIARLCQSLTAIRYSQTMENRMSDSRVMIIDNIGLLSAIYRYGTIALIGGGFGKGIHNILEPVAFGLPVLFGPRHEKFIEAQALLSNGGAFCFRDTLDFLATFDTLIEPAQLQKARKACRYFVDQNSGATTKIMDLIKSLLESNAKH